MASLISSNQVFLNSDSPISGTMAIGFPDNGTTANQGRVGLSQNENHISKVSNILWVVKIPSNSYSCIIS